MGKEAPGVLEVPDTVRNRGKLKVIPMVGWTRAMRWPETGLTFVPTSGGIRNWDAVQGFPMTGLGSYFDPSPKVNFDIGLPGVISPWCGGLVFCVNVSGVTLPHSPTMSRGEMAGANRINPRTGLPMPPKGWS